MTNVTFNYTQFVKSDLSTLFLDQNVGKHFTWKQHTRFKEWTSRHWRRNVIKCKDQSMWCSLDDNLYYGNRVFQKTKIVTKNGHLSL
jgi:hypothetical protein